MHYYIDGYNLLFKLSHPAILQAARERLIEDLNQKAALLNLNATLVFDSTFQLSEASRSHFYHLEILFTAHGETADEHIIDIIKNLRSKGQATVITSDKHLASTIRHLGALTEGVDAFTQRINKSFKKKIHKPKKETPLLVSPAPTPDEVKEEVPSDPYERLFEARYQELLLKEPIRTPKPEIISKKKKRSLFENPPSPQQKAANDMERWLKAFEERLKED
ncbi:MAG: NYN domain-containing protein [Parachlamydia sp.]|jgi:hypothetical protein|nr:NYN domain-containing protein [Parachlamydia sp.]